MKFLKNLKLFLYFIFICFLSFIILFYANQFFLIKKIELIADRDFRLTGKSELINKSLVYVDKEKLAKKIVQENSFLKTAIIDKVWPNTLKVTVDFYEPIATLVVNQGFFNLSNDGRILTKTKDNKSVLPVINYYQKINNNLFQTGDWVKYHDITQTLFFIDKLEQINLRPLTVDISGEDMLVFKLDNNKRIIFSIKKDKEEQDYILEKVVRQFKIQGKEFQGIDLRFNKPVIEF